jgi:hypothetical protein
LTDEVIRLRGVLEWSDVVVVVVVVVFVVIIFVKLEIRSTTDCWHLRS